MGMSLPASKVVIIVLQALAFLIAATVLALALRWLANRSGRARRLLESLVGFGWLETQGNRTIHWRCVLVASIGIGLYSFLAYAGTGLGVSETGYLLRQAAFALIGFSIGIPVFTWIGFSLMKLIRLGFLGLFVGAFVGYSCMDRLWLLWLLAK